MNQYTQVDSTPTPVHGIRRPSRRRRVVAALGLAAAAAVGGGGSAVRADTAPVTPFRTVMVGDSIGNIVYPLVNTPDLYWDAEPGRSPYDVGADDRAGTVEALATLMPLLAPSTSGHPTFVVVQEGATGTLDGRYITNSEWQDFVRDVIRLTGGHCLVFVSPGYGHTINGVANEAGNDVAYGRTIMARDILDDYPWRCIYTVNWWYAADRNPQFLRADGLHPSAAGAAWLASQLNQILPNP